MDRTDLIGIVVCGGESSRMRKDKSMLTYHQKPQSEHVGDLLDQFCKKVVISCNSRQFESFETQYEKLSDLPEYANSGPIAALMTVYSTFPNKDFLFIGCDYPLLSTEDISGFLSSIQESATAAAFFNAYGKYEPLLAWYSRNLSQLIKEHYQVNDLSLQSLLRKVDAQKFIPKSETAMKSVDTLEDFEAMQAFINRIHNG
ncbi:molybdenum cofactor guanylyltransferase [Dyadobacter crusticola]|uniref:molybdenum cofactor guanylyltransferase n=1 Tax=Dyadobacter crusticola TaxID=292407 RepID=UPI0004E26735|nr:molybdenum cofactor guanylyltransferase [Dyadobacter crusticola]